MSTVNDLLRRRMSYRKRMEELGDDFDELLPEFQDCVLSDEEDEKDVSGGDEKPEEESNVITLDDSDDDDNKSQTTKAGVGVLSNQVPVNPEGIQDSSTAPTGAEEFQWLFTDSVGSELCKTYGKEIAEVFDIDDFCQSLLTGETETGDGDTIDTKEGEDPTQSMHCQCNRDDPDGEFLTEVGLSHRATGVISLASAKAAMIRGLSVINIHQALRKDPSSHQLQPRVRGFVKGDDENPYSRPRLPYLRTQNRTNYARGWAHDKVSKRLEPDSFNPRFRRRFRMASSHAAAVVTSAVLEETKKLGAGYLHRIPRLTKVPNITEIHEPYDTVQTSDHTYSVDYTEESAVEASTNAANQEDFSNYRRPLHGPAYSKPIPESKVLPGLDDCTFLLSPESVVSVDSENQASVGEFGQSRKRTVLSHIQEILFGKEPEKKRKLNDVEDEEEQGLTVENENRASDSIFRVPAAPTKRSTNDVAETCSIVGDRSFVLAMRNLGKKEQGRPRKNPEQVIKPKAPSSKQSKRSRHKSTRNEIKNEPQESSWNIYMEAREAAVTRGIPKECLPTLPDLSTTKSTTPYPPERLFELINHVNSMNWGNEDEPLISSQDTYKETHGQPGPNGGADGKPISSAISSSNSMPNLQDSFAEIEEDILAIPNSIHLRNSAEDSDEDLKDDDLAEMEFFSDDDSIDEDSTSSVQVMKMLSKRVFRENELLSDIHSTSSRRKKGTGKRKGRHHGGDRIDNAEDPQDVGNLSDLSGDELTHEDFKIPPDDEMSYGKSTSREGSDILDKELHFPNDVALNVEISPDCNTSSEVDHSQLKNVKLNEVGEKLWGPMTEGRKRGTTEARFLDTLDALSINSDGPEKETEEIYQYRISADMMIGHEALTSLAQRYSASQGKHPDTLIASQNIYGVVNTLSPNIPLQFICPEKSHTIHLLNSMGFTYTSDPGARKFRIATQTGNAKEKIRDTTQKVLQSRKMVRKMITKVSFFHADIGEFMEHLNNPLMISKRNIPTCQMEFIETQLVSDLRMCLHCVKDSITTRTYDKTVEEFFDLRELAYHTNPGWFLVIEETVLYDGRYPSSLEAAHSFIHSTASQSKDTCYFLMDASVTHISELSVRFGYPYRLCHQGGCMHTIVFQQGRLSEDPTELKSLFPKYTQENVFPEQIKCALDDTSMASWVVSKSRQLEDKDHLYICKKCADQLVDNENCARTERMQVAFRILFEENGPGRIIDQDIGWKPIPSPVEDVEDQGVQGFIENVQHTRAYGWETPNKDKSGIRKPKIELRVQVPGSQEQLTLYRFLQPHLLCRALKCKLPSFKQRETPRGRK